MDQTLTGLKLKVLSEISQHIHAALDLEQALSEVLRILSETLSLKRATVTLLDPSTQRLVITASHGLSLEERSRGVYQLDEGVTGLIFSTAKPYVIPDIRSEPLFLDRTGSRAMDRGRISFVGVPILLGAKVMGVLNVDRLFGDEVALEEDVDFLTVLATMVGQFLALNEQMRKAVEDLRRENVSLKKRLTRKAGGLSLVSRGQSMLEVERQMEKVAPTKATVLLQGESGTGKTLIARIVHELSERRSHAFVKVNCAALPENLLEAELFGHEKGAFTGAEAARPGRFEEADQGTLFLDEVGEVTLAVQAKLLRVIQEKEYERLGSNRTRKADVRIIAATNRNLRTLVEQGQFREDLYYRLNVFPIRVPSLRERSEDIPSLINHFLNKVANLYGRRIVFTHEALATLSRYDWPGNVREMENLIERLVIMADAETVDNAVLAKVLAVPTPAQEAAGAEAEAESNSLKTIVRNEIVAALRRNNWVQLRAARELGLTPRQLAYRVKMFGLREVIGWEKLNARA